MKKNSFEERLLASAAQALEVARNERSAAREYDLPRTAREASVSAAPAMSAGAIARVREEHLQVSQTVFAGMLNVSPATVRSWEQGQKPPSGPALRLLQVAQVAPHVLYSFVKERGTLAGTGKGSKSPKRKVPGKSAPKVRGGKKR